MESKIHLHNLITCYVKYGGGRPGISVPGLEAGALCIRQHINTTCFSVHWGWDQCEMWFIAVGYHPPLCVHLKLLSIWCDTPRPLPSYLHSASNPTGGGKGFRTTLLCKINA